MFIFNNVCRAEEYTNYNDLIENGKTLDGRMVEIKGEAIGEAMTRGNFTWINISDGSNGIGIWVKNEDANKIKTFGSYKYKGDIIKVSGIFKRACSEHGGDMDIHEESLAIESIGYKVDRSLENSKVFKSLFLSAATLVLLGVYYMKRLKGQ
ncbi:hypothetical protein [Clostridium homopropionicum]|nr:hypothetical protein [Clostridium homopropionicum]